MLLLVRELERVRAFVNLQQVVLLEASATSLKHTLSKQENTPNAVFTQDNITTLTYFNTLNTPIIINGTFDEK